MGQLRSHFRLAAVPARKKRIYIDSSSEKPVKGRDKGLLRKLWREVWQFSKPMMAAYLAKLLAENVIHLKGNDLELRWLNRGLRKRISGVEEINGKRS
jgi:hypothetical protein